MYWYVLHNLVVQSQFPLQGLDEICGEDWDIVVRLTDSEEELDKRTTYMDHAEKAISGKIEGIGSFIIIDGREIWVYPSEGTDIESLQTYLLGPVFAVLLRQRGYLVLHASCVIIDGQGIAFLAESGWGKSTLAANFHHLGYRVFVDDLMALAMDETVPAVLPGLPWVKLWPASAVALGTDLNSLPKLNRNTEKRFQRVRETAFDPPVPLDRIYVLGIGNNFSIEKVPPSQALLDLVRHTRVTHLFTNAEDLRAQFEQCTELLQQVPVFRLDRAPGLEHIPQTVKMVLEHVREAECSDQASTGVRIPHPR